jgi:hypothetical protein
MGKKGSFAELSKDITEILASINIDSSLREILGATHKALTELKGRIRNLNPIDLRGRDEEFAEYLDSLINIIQRLLTNEERHDIKSCQVNNCEICSGSYHSGKVRKIATALARLMRNFPLRPGGWWEVNSWLGIKDKGQLHKELEQIKSKIQKTHVFQNALKIDVMTKIDNTMNTIDVSCVKLTEASIEKLIKNANEITSLKLAEIILNGKSILETDNRTFDKFLQLIGGLTKIRKLDLSRNRLGYRSYVNNGDQRAKRLMEEIKKLTTLKVLDFSCNEIDDAFFKKYLNEEFFERLEGLDKLKLTTNFLRFSDNNEEGEFVKILNATINETKAIKLEVSGNFIVSFNATDPARHKYQAHALFLQFPNLIVRPIVVRSLLQPKYFIDSSNESCNCVAIIVNENEHADIVVERIDKNSQLYMKLYDPTGRNSLSLDYFSVTRPGHPSSPSDFFIKKKYLHYTFGSEVLRQESQAEEIEEKVERGENKNFGLLGIGSSINCLRACMIIFDECMKREKEKKLLFYLPSNELVCTNKNSFERRYYLFPTKSETPTEYNNNQLFGSNSRRSDVISIHTKRRRQKISVESGYHSFFYERWALTQEKIGQKLPLDTLLTGLAEDYGIEQALFHYLGRVAHIMQPSMSSTGNPFCSEDGLREYVEKIAGHCTGDDTVVKDGFVHDDGEKLKKPIVMIINTHGVVANEASASNTTGGKHWVTCVILPKDYVILGNTISHLNERVFFIDSLYEDSKLPELFKKALIEGMAYIGKHSPGEKEFLDDPTLKETPFPYQIPPAFPAAEFYDCINIPQQEGGEDCGWWALYNAIMFVLTGGKEFTEQFTDRQRAFQLRRLFPGLKVQETDNTTQPYPLKEGVSSLDELANEIMTVFNPSKDYTEPQNDLTSAENTVSATSLDSEELPYTFCTYPTNGNGNSKGIGVKIQFKQEREVRKKDLEKLKDLAELKDIEEIDLSKNSLTDDDIERVIALSNDFKKVCNFDLSYNFITEAGLNFLMRYFEKKSESYKQSSPKTAKEESPTRLTKLTINLTYNYIHFDVQYLQKTLSPWLAKNPVILHLGMNFIAKGALQGNLVESEGTLIAYLRQQHHVKTPEQAKKYPFFSEQIDFLRIENASAKSIISSKYYIHKDGKEAAVVGLFAYDTGSLPLFNLHKEHAFLIIEGMHDFGQRYIMRADLYKENRKTDRIKIRYIYLSPQEYCALAEKNEECKPRFLQVSKEEVIKLHDEIINFRRKEESFHFEMIPKKTNEFNCLTWAYHMLEQAGIVGERQSNQSLVGKPPSQVVGGGGSLGLSSSLSHSLSSLSK